MFVLYTRIAREQSDQCDHYRPLVESDSVRLLEITMNPTAIEPYLKSLPRNEKIFFFPNPGGAGDSMIALSAYRLMRKLGIDYQIVKVAETFDPSGKVMMYGGGGNLVGYYHTARNLIQEYYPFLKKLVILPHTIRGNEDMLAGFKTNADIICREPASYAHARRHAPNANVLLMDDLALQLDARKIMEEKPVLKDRRIRALMRRDFLLKAFVPLRQLPGKLSHPASWETLNAFRKDVEARQHSYPADNVDLASLFAYGTDSEEVASYVTRRVLKIIDHYKIVRTDRLHICIAAALLGKNVEFFPNSYDKCEAVYRYSLKNRFSNVAWMGDNHPC